MRRKKGELATRQITYLVVFPFLMTLASHLWGGLPVDLVRVKGTDCNIDLNIYYPENQAVELRSTGEPEVRRLQREHWAREHSAVPRPRGWEGGCLLVTEVPGSWTP